MANKPFLVRFESDGRCFSVSARSKAEALDIFEAKYHPAKDVRLYVKEKGEPGPLGPGGYSRLSQGGGRQSPKLTRKPKQPKVVVEAAEAPTPVVTPPNMGGSIPLTRGPQLPMGPLHFRSAGSQPAPRSVTQQPAPANAIRDEIRKVIREEIVNVLACADKKDEE